MVDITKNDGYNLFDTTSEDIILVSYPPGGFGTFIYHVLSEFADTTVKVNNKNFKFDGKSTSHNTTQYTECFWSDPDDYIPKLSKDIDVTGKKVLVKCDPGLDLPGDQVYNKVVKIFPNATIIRNYINDNTKFIVYEICLKKLRDKDMFINTTEFINSNWSDSSEDYAEREFYTVAYKNLENNEIFSNLSKWHSLDKHNLVNLSIEDLINDPYECICNFIKQLNMNVIRHDELKQLCNEWLARHDQFLIDYRHWIAIEDALNTDTVLDISNITDLKTQGYINYRIEEKFNIVIPPYDYRNWFKTTKELSIMIGKILVAH